MTMLFVINNKVINKEDHYYPLSHKQSGHKLAGIHYPLFIPVFFYDRVVINNKVINKQESAELQTKGS